MRRTKAMTGALIICLGCVSMADCSEAIEIDYEDLKGARRISPETGFWEVGWDGSELSKVRYPIENLEGGIYKAWSGSEKTTGNRIISAADLGASPQEGIPLPVLGIKGDFYAIICHNVNCPARYYADDGSVAQEWWTRSHYLTTWYNMTTIEDWFSGSCRMEQRRELTRQVMRQRHAPLDSRWLDTDEDGVWRQAKIAKIRNYNVPLSLSYMVLLPATYVDVPIGRTHRKGASISFACQSGRGMEDAAFLLDPSYMPRRGTLRIGFVGHRNKVYVAQNPGSGKEGIIVGEVPALDGRLAIKPGTLKIHKAKWLPYDRIPRQRRKIIGFEGLSGSEFSLFSNREVQEWGYMCLNREYGVRQGGKAFPKRNICTRIKRDLVERGHKDTLRMAKKYGMEAAFLVRWERTSPWYIPDKYKAEVLDPETGRFVKAPYLDWANDGAAEWEAENIRRRFLPYRGLPAYALNQEGGGRRDCNNMSLDALESFREFVGDPEARFPVPPSYPETPRTSNKVKDIMRLLPTYKKWKTGYYRGHIFMLRSLKPVYEALKGGDFKGVGYFGLGGRGARFIPYMADEPEVALLGPENVRESDESTFRPWRECAGKYPDRIVLLPHSAPLLMNSSAERFVEWFTDFGLLPEVDGVVIGGGGKIPMELWKALAAKYFGKGRMGVEEADEVIAIFLEKGIFYYEEESEVKKKTEQELRNEGRSLVETENSRRVHAPLSSRTIDGNLDEWCDATWYEATGAEHLFATKEGVWTGKDDLSYSFALSYDKDNLYLAIKVRDNKVFSREHMFATGGDEAEILLAFVDDPEKDALTRDNSLTLRMIPFKEYDQVYTGWDVLEGIPESRAASSSCEDGYIIEAAIPFSRFGYKPAKGKLLPAEFHILDYDELMGGYHCSMIWNAVENKEAPWGFKGKAQWGLIELN